MKFLSLALFLVAPFAAGAEQQQTQSHIRGGFQNKNIREKHEHWLDDYVNFHRQERHMNDATARYLVLDYDLSHDGSFERNLLHIPYYVWLAYKTNRVFVLGDTWQLDKENNCGLEQFWKPNHMDWTMPMVREEDIVSFHHDSDNEYYNQYIDPVLLELLDQRVKTPSDSRMVRVQGNPITFLMGLGEVFQEESQNRRIFAQIYETLFSVTEPVQQMLDDVTEDLGLNNDSSYIAVHLDTPVNLIENVQLTQGLHKTQESEYALQQHLEQSLNFEKVVERTKLLNGNTKDDNVKLYCAGIDGTNSLPECVNGNGELESYAKHMGDEHDNQCTQYYPQIVDLYLSSRASCIGFGDDEQGLAAALFSDFECYSVHDMNPTIMQSSQRWESPFFPNPSGRRRNTGITTEITTGTSVSAM